MRYRDMRHAFTGCLILAGVCLPAVAGQAQTAIKRLECIKAIDTGTAVAEVSRGAVLQIACAGLGSRPADVRVVMSFDPGESVTESGYNAVLATDQTVSSGQVSIKVPDVPGISRHTLNVKVFVTDAVGTRSCDAGRVKVL